MLANAQNLMMERQVVKDDLLWNLKDDGWENDAEGNAKQPDHLQNEGGESMEQIISKGELKEKEDAESDAESEK